MDDTHKQILLGLALDRAEGDGIIRLVERETIPEGWASDLEVTRKAFRPIQEIGHALEVLPQGISIRYPCACRRAAVMEMDPVAAKGMYCTTIIDLDFARWIDRPEKVYNVWLGQCPECRTIYWRIQQA